MSYSEALVVQLGLRTQWCSTCSMSNNATMHHVIFRNVLKHWNNWFRCTPFAYYFFVHCTIIENCEIKNLIKCFIFLCWILYDQ
jgi:hypothetical protein